MASSTMGFAKGCRVLMAAAKTSAAAASAQKTGAAATRPPTGILKPLPVSPSLGAFLGVSEASRTDVIKKVWQHIKLNNLQLRFTSEEGRNNLILDLILCGENVTRNEVIRKAQEKYRNTRRII